MANTARIVISKSVFKNGESKTTTTQYTSKWIELINQSEKLRKTSVGR